MIGKDIELIILEHQGGEIKLGIKAPRNVVILRKEICDAVQNENKIASNLKGEHQLKDVLGQWTKKLSNKKKK